MDRMTRRANIMIVGGVASRNVPDMAISVETANGRSRCNSSSVQTLLRIRMGFPTKLQATARILVVEDEALLRMLIADELRGAGYEVLEVDSADDAEELIIHEEGIDLVFTDVQMPGRLDGLALAREIQDCRPEIPVIITSGKYGPCDVTGLGRFVPKPYDFAAVRHLVDEVLDR